MPKYKGGVTKNRNAKPKSKHGTAIQTVSLLPEREAEVAQLIRSNRWTEEDIRVLVDKYQCSRNTLYADRRKLIRRWREVMHESDDQIREETARVVEEARHLRRLSVDTGKLDVAAKLLAFEAKILGLAQPEKIEVTHKADPLRTMTPEEQARITLENLEMVVRLADPVFARAILQRCLAILPIDVQSTQSREVTSG